MNENQVAPSHKSIVEVTQGDELVEVETKSKNKLKSIIEQFCDYQPNEDYTAPEQIESILNRTDCFTIFPFLFTSMLESEVKKKNAILPDELEATNGFRMLGNLQKLLYGKLLIGKLP
jgi:hypothetical protein